MRASVRCVCQGDLAGIQAISIKVADWENRAVLGGGRDGLQHLMCRFTCEGTDASSKQIEHQSETAECVSSVSLLFSFLVCVCVSVISLT